MCFATRAYRLFGTALDLVESVPIAMRSVETSYLPPPTKRAGLGGPFARTARNRHVRVFLGTTLTHCGDGNDEAISRLTGIAVSRGKLKRRGSRDARKFWLPREPPGPPQAPHMEPGQCDDTTMQHPKNLEQAPEMRQYIQSYQHR
jgi:hypothetical protein